MNIISNNCTAGWIYKQSGIQYNNPFVFTIMTPKDFTNLINNYDTLNFGNREIRQEGTCYVITIDGLVDIKYIHHKEKDVDTPYIKIERGDRNMYGRNMKDYILSAYDRRVSRMEGPPLFIISEREHPREKGKYVVKYDAIRENLNTPYRIIVDSRSKTSTRKVASSLLIKNDYIKKEITNEINNNRSKT